MPPQPAERLPRVPAKRRGVSLSTAISGGSSNTVLSFSVTMPWYVGSSHGLCLLTVLNRSRERKRTDKLRVVTLKRTALETHTHTHH